MVDVQLDEQARAVLDELVALGARPAEELTPVQARAQPTTADAVRGLRARRGEDPAPEAVASVQDESIPGPGGPIAIRIYRPRVEARSGALPVLVYFHGGGWVVGNLDYVEASARALANRAECVVVSAGYRLAPEHPFPAAYDDALTSAKWVAANSEALGADPDRVAVGGESAGATLATATCLALKQEGHRLPRLQLLIYPPTDLVGQDYPSYADSADAHPLSMERWRWFLRHALSEPGQAQDVRLSPLLAPLESLAGLPPALVITAASDPLRDQGEAYALKLMDAGVRTTLTRYPGVMHGFFLMGAVLDPARVAVSQAAAALRAGFEAPV